MPRTISHVPSKFNCVAFYAVLIAFSFFILSMYSCQNSQEEIKPALLDITESVYSSVTIQPDSMYAVYSAVTGILDEMYVEEGDLVNKQTALVRMINSTPELNIENARLSLDLARSNFNGQAAQRIELENEIATAKLNGRDDSIKYVKQKRLWEQNIGTQNEVDNLRLKYEVSANLLKSLRNKLERTEMELKTQLEQAENNYQNSLIKNNDFTIRSKMNGRVYDVLKNPGELLSGQEPLAYIGSAQHFIIEMLVDEVDIGQIQIDQQILVVLDAFGEQVFTARVKKIAPKMDERSQTFLVEGVFDDQPSKLYSGLTGEANIIISEKKDALTIPLNYLVNKEYVLTEEGQIPVTTGVQNLSRIEILSGLDTSVVLIKPN